MERYAIYMGSLHGNCCFNTTVVDTTRPIIICGEHYKDLGPNGQYHYDAVCECFTVEDAELVCTALNALDAYTTPARTHAMLKPTSRGNDE